MPSVPVGADTFALLLAGILMVWFAPALILYVTVTGNVCGLVKVTIGDGAPWQTDVVPLMFAAGVGRTTTVVDPAVTLEHKGAA
jgi:hypothetical protein